MSTRTHSTKGGRAETAEELVRERLSLLLRSFGDDPDFLAQWMASYLAELLARSEDESVPLVEREAARTELARLVPQFWEQREKRRVRELQQRVYDSTERVDIGDAKLLPTLQQMLEHPAEAAGKAKSALQMLGMMNSLENLLLQLLIIANDVSKFLEGEGVSSDSVHRYGRWATDVQRKLGRVLPELGSVDLGDWDAVERLAVRAIESMSLIRLHLIGSQAAGEGGTRPRKTRKRAAPKRSK